MADVCSRARTDSCLAATFTRLDGKSLLVTSTSRDMEGLTSSRSCFSLIKVFTEANNLLLAVAGSIGEMGRVQYEPGMTGSHLFLKSHLQLSF
jgi:hypothetical protein